MKREYRIIQGESREHLEKQINAIIEERPYGWDVVGSLVVIPGEMYNTFYQAIIKSTMEGVKTGLMNAESGVVEEQ